MKKSIFSIGSTLCLASILFFSCKKETNSPASTPTSQTKQVKGMSVMALLYSPENVNNPYDYVGQIHNKALEQMAGNRDNQIAFKRSWLSYTGTMLSENGFSQSDFTEIMTNDLANKELGNFDPFKMTELTSSQLDTWSNANAISLNLKNFYTNINDYISIMGKDGNYQAFKASMIKLEATTTNFSDQDKVMALSSAAIARYSFSYWLSNNNTGGISMPMGWGKADFGGACGGAVRASVVGFFGGPVGWGAWAGAVLGGAAASSIISLL